MRRGLFAKSAKRSPASQFSINEIFDLFPGYFDGFFLISSLFVDGRENLCLPANLLDFLSIITEFLD